MKMLVVTGVPSNKEVANLALELADRGFDLIAAVKQGKTWRVTGRKHDAWDRRDVPQAGK